MSDLPLVSIIVPYFDFADYLSEAVASAHAQTYENIEIVVVDDCSPIRPAEEIISQSLFRNLKVIRHDCNQGAAAARNTGVLSSNGSLIVALDSDDRLAPTFVEKTVKALHSTNLGGIYTQVEIFGTQESLWIPEINLLNVMTAQPGPPSFLYRREVFDSVGGYRAGLYHADAEFWLSILKKGWEFQRIEEPLFRYRKHGRNSSTANRTSEVASLAGVHRDLYVEDLEAVLQALEEKYWRAKDEFQALAEGFAQLKRSRDAEHEQLEDFLAQHKRKLRVKLALAVRSLMSPDKTKQDRGGARQC